MLNFKRKRLLVPLCLVLALVLCCVSPVTVFAQADRGAANTGEAAGQAAGGQAGVEASSGIGGGTVAVIAAVVAAGVVIAVAASGSSDSVTPPVHE